MFTIRRWYMAVAVLMAGCASVRTGPNPSHGNFSTGDLSDNEAVAHVLSRLTFGARPGDAERVRAMGIEKWIDEQLHPSLIPDSALTVALAPIKVWTVPVADIPAANAFSPQMFTRLIAPPKGAGADSVKKIIAVQSASLSLVLGGGAPLSAGKLIRAQTSEHQLEEVMADFWENHFSVFINKMPTRDALAIMSRDAIRPRVLGKFRDLLGAVAHSPAMLFYLDNQLNARGAANENYARELMELHTLGVDGGYTQNDVIEVARALTGWGIAGNAARPVTPVGPTTLRPFEFLPARHDTGSKLVLGKQLAAGRGIEDGEEVLDIVARHPSTARFIATKLARRFVSDSPPPALIARAAEVFLKSDGDIAEVVRAIVTSPEFFARSSLRSKVKSPFELVVSTRRALNIPGDTTFATMQFLNDFGQPMFGKQTPDGWPDVGTAWMNSGTLMKRILFGADVVEGRLPTFAADAWPGWAALKSVPAEQQASGVIELILGGIASSETRSAMLAATSDGDTRLREIVAIALGSPEFQRR